MNKLLAMKAFIHVAQQGSFTAAADRLDVSVSAIAKAVSRLEADLGVQLLNRTTRVVSLTDAGREFYASCQRILSDIEETELALKRSQAVPQGRVRLTLPVSFGRVTFLPRVAEFRERYPDIKLDLTFRDSSASMLQETPELAVYVGDLGDAPIVARQLNRGPRVCVASPAYLERHGVPQVPQDLLMHNCIAHYPGPVWQFRMGRRLVEVKVDGNLEVNTGDHVREAALLGLGIAQSNWWTFRHDIASGRLVAILREYETQGRPISVIYRKSRYMPLKLKVTIDFLIEITRL